MNEQSTRQRLRNIISDVFECPEPELPDNPGQDKIGNWDSLEHLRLIMMVENEFDIKFQTERLPHLTSLELILSEMENAGG